MPQTKGSTRLSPTAREAIEALGRYGGQGATLEEVALHMPIERTAAGISRGINTACRAGAMHWRPITPLRPGQVRRLYPGPRPT